MLQWPIEQGDVEAFAVEGAGSYGTGLVRFLRPHGMAIVEVDRPVRKKERRLHGKSDTIDADHAARQVIAGQRMAIPKAADGVVEMLRLVKIARDTAVKTRGQAPACRQGNTRGPRRLLVTSLAPWLAARSGSMRKSRPIPATPR